MSYFSIDICLVSIILQIITLTQGKNPLFGNESISAISVEIESSANL